MKINEFFGKDYVNYASYDNYRKICSYIDGLKPSARKILFTLLEKNITSPKKVSILKSSVSEFTNYIHGEVSLIGPLVGLAQDFVGTNNIPLLKREGNFGNRLIPVPSADRYIFTCLEDITRILFNKDDDEVLIKQFFEGEEIEYKYYVPLIPMLLVNGSEGLSTGFSQKILSRNPIEIIDNIINRLQNKKYNEILPYFKGYIGKIVKNENGGFSIYGKYNIKSNTEIEIIEAPIGYTLKSYEDILKKLEENKVINSYKNLCDPKKKIFKYLINVKAQFIKNSNEEDILEKLKLIKRVSENLTCMDENNAIRVFSNITEILESFIKIRLDYYLLRKENLLNKIDKEISLLKNRLIFIREIVNDKLVINKRNKKEIIEDLQKLQLDLIDGSYDYLLNMSIYSLTTEKVQELVKKYKEKNEERKILAETDINDMYINELNELRNILSK